MHLLQLELIIVGLRGKVKTVPKRRKDRVIIAGSRR
jgi:hypothetical protein